MKNILSPVRLSDLNPFSASRREIRSFFHALQVDGIVILARRNGTWWLATEKTCAHQLIEAAQELIDAGMKELTDHE